MTSPIYKTLDVQRISDTTVEVKRSFQANRELTYKAFTSPPLLKRWMLGPPGWEMPVCDMDLKEGGKYEWRWRNKSDKSEFGFKGIYKQVKPNEKIVNTQVFDPGTLGGDMGQECLITVTFTEGSGLTTVITRMDYKSKDDLEKAVSTGMTDGMEMSYQMLDQTLKTR
jgi:uncharacterized protein YndB with AHSA1/START domain